MVIAVNEATRFLMLREFMPLWAQEIKMVGENHDMLNDLGFTRMSSFATFAYCAAPHIDKDLCPSMGHVLYRSSKVKQGEHDFVWAAHGFAIEMAEDMIWGWDARSDPHGTTHGRFSLTHPRLFKSAFAKNKDSAQWTVAWTIPQAVGNAWSGVQ
ncbi:hypothetical protein BDY19DRAFT_966670 [Irpex rosettiformis]|uniref:Uncharacterized protein n=1 Tax=Irpex rosettiformis TaxID=378272 RepID=A0ACB8TTS9_9APHY|nr:hypothetical protein BDY19DRAFT_966670 [Irpex rosettiformis]